MMHFIYEYLVLAGVLLVLDALWIGLVARKLYQKEIGELLRAKAQVLPAVVFYVIYLWAIIFLVLDPALQDNHSFGWLLARAAALGFAAYATYDLTNLSTIKGWTKKMAVSDLLWGTFLTTAVSSVAYLIFS